MTDGRRKDTPLHLQPWLLCFPRFLEARRRRRFYHLENRLRTVDMSLRGEHIPREASHCVSTQSPNFATTKELR